MSILKNRSLKNFSIIPNAIIIDKRLSANAFRIYCYLASRPDGWKVNNIDIKNQLDIKDKDTLTKYWKELLASGWLERTQEISEGGKFTGLYNYTLWEKPEYGKNPNTGKTRIREKPEYGKNPPLNKNDLSNNNKEHNNNTCTTNLAKQKEKKEQNKIEQKFDYSNFGELEIIAIKDWLQYKKEKHQSYTPIGLKGLRTRLLKLKENHSIAEIIEFSTSNSYQGLIEPKTKQVNTHNNNDYVRNIGDFV